MTERKYELVLIALAMLVFAGMLAVSAFQFAPLEALPPTQPSGMGYTEQNVVSTSLQSRTLCNINTASVDELIELPGIGKSKAQAIVTYREENGAFRTLEELMLVPGIGKSLYESMKELVTLG